MKKIKNKSAGIILSSLFMVLLLAPLSQAQIPPGPLSDLLTYYAHIYNTPQIPEPFFAKKVVAKAQPDECFNGIGAPITKPPCSEGKPKVNQAYVWGLTQQGNVWFGTAPNVLCLVIGGILGSAGTPIEAPSFVCEFGEGPLVPPLPASIGDWRAPRIYEYNPETQDVIDRTPLAGPLINKTLGLRSAGSLDDVIFLAGPGLGNGINMFAFKSDGSSLGAKNFPEYNDIRKWAAVDGTLYTAVQNTAGGGTVLRWIGSDVDPFQFEVVGKLDTEGSNIALHEGRLFITTWPATLLGGQPSPPISLYMSPIVPPGGLTSADANNWVKVWKSSDYEPDKIVVSTYAGGDLASFDGTLFWGTMHVPFLATQAALGLAEKGVINLDPAGDGLGTDDFLTTALGTHRAISIFSGKNFGTPGQKIEVLYGEQYLPVYDPAAKSYTIAEDAMHQNKMPNPVPKYGPSGIGNFFNTYTWTMGVGFKKTPAFTSLLVGTFDWSYVLEQMLVTLANQQGGANPAIPGITLDPEMLEEFMDHLQPQLGFGADLFVARSADQPFTLESNDGVGNYLNYGIRTMLPSEPQTDGLADSSAPQDFAYKTTPQDFCNQTTTQNIFYLGMANPMNLETDPDKPQGGWELIQLSLPISPVQGTIGTKITIRGTCLKYANVYIGSKKCKVLSSINTKLVCEINSALPPGIYDVKIKGKKCDEILYENAFEIMAPVVCSLSQQNCNNQFTVKGGFFGNKDSSLKFYFGPPSELGDKCKLISDKMNPVTGESTAVIVLPKEHFASGPYNLKVKNQVGFSIFEDEITICKLRGKCTK